MENVKELYGVEPMTFEDTMELWKTNPNIARTRNNKIRLCTAFRKMKELAEFMERYSKSIPIEDDDYHSAIVNNLTEEMETLWQSMDKTIYDAIYNPKK